MSAFVVASLLSGRCHALNWASRWLALYSSVFRDFFNLSSIISRCSSHSFFSEFMATITLAEFHAQKPASHTRHWEPQILAKFGDHARSFEEWDDLTRKVWEATFTRGLLEKQGPEAIKSLKLMPEFEIKA